MSSLRPFAYTIDAADMGDENPLPEFRDPQADHTYTLSDRLTDDERRYMGWQVGSRVLPWMMQDGYTRRRQPRTFSAWVLENRHLRALVLPELGGRLASLLHVPSQTELLTAVTHYQPANLALRNAWIAGGVEWNMPLLGHHYLTCAPLWAGRASGPDGCDVLRLWFWERTKRLTCQIDMCLPDASPVLLVHVTVHNPHPEMAPMYWWSNIAVPQAPDRRVLAPADEAIYNTRDGFDVTSITNLDGVDVSRTETIQRAHEFFFRIAPERRKWICSLDGQGRGLVQTSTDRLLGRKLFVWGASPGGNRWQEHLLEPGRAYVEIQAGLCRTQMESIPMPGNTMWDWTEAYGLLQANPQTVHGADWRAATNHAEQALERLIPKARLDTWHQEMQIYASRPPAEILHAGDGWGSLERLRAQAASEPVRIPASTPVPESAIGAPQRKWLALLQDGRFPAGAVTDPPTECMTQPEWEALLLKALEHPDNNHWRSWYHLGVMRMERGDHAGARDAWLRSTACTANPWALRNLAVCAMHDERPDEALAWIDQAWQTGVHTVALAVEYAQHHLRHGDWALLHDWFSTLPDAIRTADRIRMAEARVALIMGNWDRTEQLLEQEYAQIREGEVSLTDIWFDLQEALHRQATGRSLTAEERAALQPPYAIDFRMSG